MRYFIMLNVYNTSDVKGTGCWFWNDVEQAFLPLLSEGCFFDTITQAEEILASQRVFSLRRSKYPGWTTIMPAAL